MEKIMEIKNLKKYFAMKSKKVLKAVDNITIDIYKGEVLSLVGESGSGKTTMGRTVSRLYEKTAGEVKYKGKLIEEYSIKDFSKKVQMIFQDPQASLNPRMTIGDIIAEGLDIHKLCATREERTAKIYDLLETVGLNKEHANRFPHEFSGGQRQRIGIARALAVQPEVLLMDEPFGALDAQTRTQLQTELLKTWESERKTCFFITHDVDEAIILAQRVIVMSARPGRIKDIVDIDIPYPRDQETKMSPRFMELKNHIWSQVYQEYLEVRK